MLFCDLIKFYKYYNFFASQVEKKIVDDAMRFTRMCYKLSSDSSVKGDIYYYKKDTPTGMTLIFAKHVFDSNKILEYAHDCAKSYNKSEVEYCYNEMINRYKLDQSDLISFPDISGFFDLLQGGIPEYNGLVRYYSFSQIMITQKLGKTLSQNADVTLKAIRKKSKKFGKSTQTSYNGFTLSL